MYIKANKHKISNTYCKMCTLHACTCFIHTIEIVYAIAMHGCRVCNYSVHKRKQ